MKLVSPKLATQYCNSACPELAISLYIKMLDFMRVNKGVGLAAPQIGIKERFFVADLKYTKDKLFINPILLVSGKTFNHLERCLTHGDLSKSVIRHTRAHLSYLNEHSKFVERFFKGLDASIVQHEMDHLNGLTILQKDISLKGKRML